MVIILSSRSLSGKNRLRELIVLAMIAALMVATQVALAALPNIHLVAVFVILAAMLFGWRSLYSVYIFVVLEALIYGLSMWVINYLYVWTVLAIVAIAFRSNRSALFWAAVSGAFGLGFGALCAIPYAIAGGWAAGFAYWVAGIPFDLLHCASNAVLAFVLLMPLYRLCCRLLGRTDNL
jgi:energy-coupling factor transport system substrate-specific component